MVLFMVGIFGYCFNFYEVGSLGKEFIVGYMFVLGCIGIGKMLIIVFLVV